MLQRELKACYLKELLPSDPLNPLSDSLMLPCTRLIGLEYLATVSFHLGGVLGSQGIASFENFGLLLRFETLPPITIAIPSFLGSAIGMAGQTE